MKVRRKTKLTLDCDPKRTTTCKEDFTGTDTGTGVECIAGSQDFDTCSGHDKLQNFMFSILNMQFCSLRYEQSTCGAAAEAKHGAGATINF